MNFSEDEASVPPSVRQPSQLEVPVPSTIPARPDEWRAILTGIPNVLVEGPADQAEAVVRAILSELKLPYVEWHPAHQATQGKTVVVLDVDRLDIAAQRELLAWTDVAGAGGPLRLLSTCARPLLPLVERGLFLPVLHYRLNVILLLVPSTPSSTAAHDDQPPSVAR